MTMFAGLLKSVCAGVNTNYPTTTSLIKYTQKPSVLSEPPKIFYLFVNITVSYTFTIRENCSVFGRIDCVESSIVT